ncbi:MAG: head GIN domain-containing protein [Crocinitomicaceae bacterium]
MRNLGLLLALTGISFLTSCKKIDAAKGTPIENTVDLTGFTGIDLATSSNLSFTEGAGTSITVKAPEKVFNKMDIKIKDGVLEFDFKRGYIVKNSDQIEINITAPNINALYLSGSGIVDANFDALISKIDAKLSVSGSGKIEAKNLTTTNLDIAISGSGEINNSNVLVTDTKVSISGSGNLFIAGNCSNNDIKISGSGSFKGYDYMTDNTEVKVSGSGDAQVMANVSLNANISGSGRVFYKGTPNVNSTITGSGSVTDAN